MNFSKYFLFVAAAFLVVFARQSDAGLLGSIATAVESGLSALLNSFEKAVSEGIEHAAFDLIKKDLQNLAAKASDDEANQIMLEGMNEIMDLVRASADAAYDALREANSSTASPEAINENLGKAFDKSHEYIVAAGAKYYLVLGALAAISEEGAKQGLTECSHLVTDIGVLAFAGLDASRDLAIQGITSGKNAAIQGILAGFRGVQATEEEIYDLVIRAAIKAYAALLTQSSPVVVNSLERIQNDQAAAASPECQETLATIEESAKIALAAVTSEKKLKAIQIIRDGLIEGAKNVARAGRITYNALDAAKLIPSKELAVAAVKKGIDSSKYKCVSTVAIGQLALGAAAKIFGQEIITPVIDSMILVEKSKFYCFNGLENSFVVASQGIEHNASEKALRAAKDGVATAGYSAYAEISKSATLSFDAIVLA